MALSTIKQELDYLLDNGGAVVKNVKWGNRERQVVIIDGKQYQYKGGNDINKFLEKNNSFIY